jgi:SAM-dependent methyltransferase
MAKHSPFSKNRWLDSVKAEMVMLKGSQMDTDQIREQAKRAQQLYAPFIQPVSKHLEDDALVLEIGSGVNCISQIIPKGKKIYLDPLLEDIKKKWPGLLPQGEMIASGAESIHLPDRSVDLIVCINAISHMHNPELVLHEMERLIKPDGNIIISVRTWPSLFARLHYFTARIYPQRVLRNRLYCYTRKGIEKTLKRHFTIHSAQLVPHSEWHLFKEWFYVCKPLETSQSV